MQGSVNFFNMSEVSSTLDFRPVSAERRFKALPQFLVFADETGLYIFVGEVSVKRLLSSFFDAAVLEGPKALVD